MQETPDPICRIAWRFQRSGEVGRSPRRHSRQAAEEIAVALREDMGDEVEFWIEEEEET